MDWSKRTMSDTLYVEKYTVNDIFVDYLRDQFYVNRRYQRKLVWDLKEKSLLIDSMLKHIPLPAVLLVKFDLPEENRSGIMEIVDGMQRLNAIVSFIMGEFGVEYRGKICYFDPDSYNETFQLRMSGDKRIKLHKNLLPKDVCMEYLRYQLPAIITGKDDATVEMIFGRINSTGKKISSHDLRQSRAVGEFPDLVRRIASDVRMDNTYDDRILLSEMPQISIGNKNHGYGVDIDTVFWRRHDLVNRQNIKESKDEEIIENLLATILLGNFQKTKDILDDLYEQGTELNLEVEAKVRQYGKNTLEDEFKLVFDTFDMIFNSVNSNFSSYLFEKKKTRNKDECFKILFLTIYKLINAGYIILNYSDVAEAIKGAGRLFDSFTQSDKTDYNEMDGTVRNLYNILKPSFTKQIIKQNNSMTDEIDKRLCYSRIECQMTEFKIGISNFSSSTVNMNVIHDIAHTLVAMANTVNAKDKEGLVILGIADTKRNYDDWHNEYNAQAVISNQHYIPGVTKEAEKLYRSTDRYYRELRKLIEQEKISTKLKEYILETFEPVDYHGVELIVFRSKYMNEISTCDGIKYIRHSNETRPMKSMRS